MEFNFNATGQKRKALVAAMTELLNTSQKYLGAPTFAYEIGDYRIDKEGVVTGEYSLSLMAALEEKGFEYETKPTFHLITPRGTLLMQEHFDTEEEARKAGYGNYFSHQGRGIFSKRSGEDEKSTLFALVGEPFSKEESTPEIVPEPEADITSIEYPLEGFTPKAIDNLKKMVLAREALIKKALDTDTLSIEILEDHISFPWFTAVDSDHIMAYSQFIAALCNTSKEKKRVTAKAPESFENEKFSMRVWLIGLGMVGAEYGAARKLLCKNLSGDTAWRYGKPEKDTKAEE